MPDSLRARTARASLFLLHENLRDLREYTADRDPDQIDRLIKTAELTSTTIKKLLAWIAEEPSSTSHSPASAGQKIQVASIIRYFRAMEKGALCPQCGGVRCNEPNPSVEITSSGASTPTSYNGPTSNASNDTN